MIRNNYHTHTCRCGHALGTDEQFVQAAIKAGIRKLGFSDHAPYRKSCRGIRMYMKDLKGYVASVQALKEKYKDRIEILMGLEVEALPEEWATLSRYRRDFDYLILGQHFLELDKGDAYSFDKPEQLHEYVKKIEYGASHHLVECIAHPDLPLYGYPYIDGNVLKMAEDLAEISLKYDVPLEINCGSGCKIGWVTYLGGMRLPYPVKEVFDIFIEKGCKLIIGMDAHEPYDFLTDERLDLALSITDFSKAKILEDYDILAAAKRNKALFY